MQVLDTVKFSYQICKGTVDHRKQRAFNLLKLFSEKLDDEFLKSKQLTPKKVEKLIYEVLPEKNICFSVEKSPECENCFSYYSDLKNQILTFLIELKTNSRNKLDKKDKNSILHETWHLFETLLNPKYTARNQLFSDLELDKYYSFYEKYLYPGKNYPKEAISINLNSFIKKFNTEKQLHILQSLRYDLIGELNAYTVANNFAPENLDICKCYKFEEKINLITDLFKEIIRAHKNKN